MTSVEDELLEETIIQFRTLLERYIYDTHATEEWFEEFDEWIKVGVNDNEEDGWECFKNKYFNDWEDSGNDFWECIGSEELDDDFKTGEVLTMMTLMAEEFNDRFETKFLLTNKNFNSERKIWNCLAYWAVETEMGKFVKKEFTNRFNDELDSKN